MTAEELLQLVGDYRQASDDQAAERLAQVDAAVTGLANERDNWRWACERARSAFDDLMAQHVQLKADANELADRYRRLTDPKPPADTSWIQTTEVKAGDERRGGR